MRKLLLFLCCVGIVASALAQTQTGYVKTRGRMGNQGKVIPGTRIQGATVQVKGRTAVVTQTNGTFSFPIPANKFSVLSVKKPGPTRPTISPLRWAHSAG